MIAERRGVPAGAWSGPLKVLVVDGDKASRAALQRAIMAIGHRCAVAGDGNEAWRTLEAHPADVVVADWMMPGMSGIDLCKRVRATTDDTYTYLILLGELSDKQHFLEGMAAGADDYISKPVDLDELRARLFSARRVMSLHKRLAATNRALRKDSETNFLAARIDPLTLVANRRQLDEDLAALFATPYRMHHSAALCDVDRFKDYNDRFDHQAGDQALRKVAAEIRRALRQGDGLYRYGGEEFLVILRDQRLDAAVQAMDRVLAAVRGLEIAHPDGPAGVVTISAGVAELTAGVTSPEDWLRRADAALYRAKANGRDRVEVNRASVPPLSGE